VNAIRRNPSDVLGIVSVPGQVRDRENSAAWRLMTTFSLDSSQARRCLTNPLGKTWPNFMPGMIHFRVINAVTAT